MMKFWSKLATWKKVLIVLALLIVLLAAAVVGLAARWWLHLAFGTGSQICIPQGSQTILFTTFTSTRAIRPGADGELEEVLVRLDGKESISAPLLPQCCIPDSDKWVPLFDWQDEYKRDKLTGKKRAHQWTDLLFLDLQTLESRLILSAEGYIFPFGPLNCLDGRFMNTKPNYQSGNRWGPEQAAIFNVEEATFSTIEAPLKEHRGLILLGEHDYVGVGYNAESGRSDEAYSERLGYLSRSGENVVDNVYDIVGVTFDLKRVFFVKHEPQASAATIAALWTYAPDDGTSQRLMEWTGEKLRVSADSKRFGFLETEQTDKSYRHVILGAHVFDMNGNAIQHFRFSKPIRPARRAALFDWSPDWGVIAYFDESDVVVQSLDGEVLGRFRLIQWSHIRDFYRSRKRDEGR
ncbi:hypothetical protein J7M28_07805 [bacterium]|nr:hypothetical protein [bacterium]